jgi:hypothetical protein
LDYASGLNEQGRRLDRMAQAQRGARRLDVAAAYAKSPATSRLMRLGLPPGGRAVVGVHFGITDPVAVDQIEAGGVEVRVVPDGAITAPQFHLTRYVVERPDELVTGSGSANLEAAAGD